MLLKREKQLKSQNTDSLPTSAKLLRNHSQFIYLLPQLNGDKDTSVEKHFKSADAVLRESTKVVMLPI